MDLHNIIMYLVPAAQAGVDFRLQDDGDGPYIAHWNAAQLGPQPDGATLAATEPAAELAMTVARKLAYLQRECDGQLAAITREYPAAEIASWDKQESEARAYLADATAVVPFIAALTQARGLGVADLAQRIVAKADAYTVAAATVIGRRQAREDQVSAIVANLAATDDEKRTAIAAVVW